MPEPGSCEAPGCHEVPYDGRPFCDSHWWEVPEVARDRVLRVVRRHGRSSWQYRDAVRRARESLEVDGG